MKENGVTVLRLFCVESTVVQIKLSDGVGIRVGFLRRVKRLRENLTAVNY